MTIQFESTAELNWKATAYVRRNAMFFRIALVTIAIVGLLVLLLPGQIPSALRWISGGIGLCAAAVFVNVQAAPSLAAKGGGGRQPHDSQMTFTDDGFGYDKACPEYVVSWGDVTHTRIIPDCWSIHYLREGREHLAVVPAEAIDDGLAELIKGKSNWFDAKASRTVSWRRVALYVGVCSLAAVCLLLATLVFEQFTQ